MNALTRKEFWFKLRERTRAYGRRGNGKGWCDEWCQDALTDVQVRRVFHEERAVLGEIQIDQYAPSLLVHHWLEGRVTGKVFVADGTAGQYDESMAEGFYDFVENAPNVLKAIYRKKV